MIANNKQFHAEWETLNNRIGQLLTLAHSEPTVYNNATWHIIMTQAEIALNEIHKMKRAEEKEFDQRMRNLDALAAKATPSKTGTGTHADPIRYEHIAEDDPARQEKREAQREQFGKDAAAGRVLCLSDLMISHGM